MTEIYDVDNYEDDELYEILGINLEETPDPEPETIESTIINQLQNYQYSRTVTGRKMYQFLKDIYNHFFTQFDETEDNPDDDFTYRDLNVLENVDYNVDQVQSTTPPPPSDTTPDIDDYITTDDDGIAILSDYGKQELGNPSDGEIEAKIIDLLQKATTKQEFNLYRTLYQTLFETNTEEEIEKVEDALQQENDDTNTPILQTKMTDMKTTTKDTQLDKDKITYQKDLNYTPGVVNPILKETYRRIVSVDSQFREDVYPHSTDFTLNFTETLKDVVSMKLYAVQIPVTWYTISKNYGSNFFYLKPANTTHNYAIYNNPNHEYKVEIEPGNYTPQLLADEIHTKLQTLSTVYPDVSFGTTTGYNYVTATTMGSFTIDLQKVYNEAYYSMDISGDILNQALQTTQTQQIQNFHSIQSNVYDISYDTHKLDTYKVDQNNNTITIIQYTSQQPNTTSYDQATDTIIETIEIKLFESILIDPQTSTTTKTVNEIFTELKSQLENHPKLTQSSISIVDPTSTPTSTSTSFYYEWKIRLNNKTTQSVPNSKISITFPDPLNDPNNTSSTGNQDEGNQNKILWVNSDTSNASSSAFNMPSRIMEPHIYSQTLAANSHTNTYIIPESAIIFRPLPEENNGVYISNPTYRHENDLTITIPASTEDNPYTTETLITAIQTEITNTNDPRLQYTKIIYKEETTSETVDGTIITTTIPSWTIRPNINHYYTTHDYRIVFYDMNDFTKCISTGTSYRNSSADTTLGYILGFKDLTEYDMDPTENIRTQDGIQYYVNPETQQRTNSIYTTESPTPYRDKITLKGGSVVNTSLYNYFMIILDDFNQNHLNDGLVTVAPNDNSVTLPHYATRKNYRGCTDPITNTQESSIDNNPSQSAGLTQKQIYSIEQIIETQNQTRSRMSNGPYVKDMFALLPVKASSAPGSMYVEFGGTLQQQERVYFGPVNIRRISIKLCNDKGDVVDLNGNNWSFQLVCEQLYRGGT